MTTKNNDPRASHTVHVYDHSTNVKFRHKGYEISLASDGQEVIVFDKDINEIAEFAGASARRVADAVKWIDENT